MNQPEPLVAIIVLTWNQRDLTLDCLASLAAMHYPSDRLQIIVVDNGSQDNTPAAIRTRFPAVTVVENHNNLGFAAGNNVGVSLALQGDAEYVMLLNNDTVVDGQMLARLLTVIQSQADVGIVGPKMLYFDPPNVIWCAGNRLGRWPWITHRLQAEQPDGALDELPHAVDYITACGILLRRAVIEQIGLLDPRFFIYYEETDWCYRARRAGWRILYVPDARLWHKVSAAMGATSPATDYYMNRNLYLFLAKNRPALQRPFMLAAVFVRQMLAIAAYAVKPHGGARTPNRNARLFALRDALTGRWGKMGPDVSRVCYPPA
jgi:GT2 family glycosyltransferase